MLFRSDDEGNLGALRIRKSYQVLNKTDIAVLIVDGTVGFEQTEIDILSRIEDKKIPHVIAVNKAEQIDDTTKEMITKQIPQDKNLLFVSAATGENITELKELIARQVPSDDMTLKIVGDLLEPEDLAVLVVPIDSAAPKGRLILPQQQTIRDVLEAGAISVVTRESELPATLKSLAKKPKLVITDSQAFGKVSKDTPEDILLTSFSILFARYKGDLLSQVRGAKAIDDLKDGDVVLISEGCTHHRQCDDIGTVKMPRWIKGHTEKDITFEFTSGTEFPDDLSRYAMIVHCGGCTLNEREMKYRVKCAQDQNIPMTNYGVLIAYMHGILERSLMPFPEILEELKR